MQKNINNILVFIITLLIFGNTCFAEKVNPDAVYKFIKHEYILNEDGSFIFNYSHKIKLLSSFAVNRIHGESFIVYNPDWQELEVTKSETTMADGSLVSSPMNAYNEVLPRFAANATPYMNLREMVVTHTGLERKCKVELAYSLFTKAGYLPGMMGKIVIGNNDFIQQFEIVIKVPKGKELNLFMANKGPKGEVKTKGNYDIYSWKLQNIPLIPPEAGQPQFEEFMPVLYFSTANKNEIVKHILGDERLFYLDDNAKKKAEELVEGKFSKNEKALAIRDYVFNDVGMTNANLIYLGYKPMTAQETFDRNVGSSLDRAILLTAMCRELGIDADVLLAANNEDAQSNISILTQFGNCLVYCPVSSSDDITIILEPNSIQKKILPSTVEGKVSFILDTKKIYLVPSYTEENELVLNAKIELDDKNNLKGSGQVKMRGYYIPSLKAKSINKIIKKSFSKFGFEVAAKENEHLLSSANSIMRSFELKSAKQLETIAGLIRLELPALPGGLKSMNLELSPSFRSTPYKLPTTINESINLTIELPDGIKLASNPKAIKIDNETGSIASSIVEENGKIKIVRNIKINSKKIEPDKYSQLFELITAWNDKANWELYFE